MNKNKNIIKKNTEHKYIFYNIYSVHGDIKHYYHFLLGVFIPMILEYIKYQKRYENITFIIDKNLGPFFRILFELPIDIKLKMFMPDFDELKIENKYLIPLDTQLMNLKNISFIQRKYAGIFTYSIYKKINNWFHYQIDVNNIMIKPIQIYDIVIIERKTNICYKSLYSKKNKVNNIFKTSGSERRTIINHNEFVKNIKKYYPNNSVLNKPLECLSIYEQYYLFNNAKLIIAQHGASLANIIFINNIIGNVIEIVFKDRLKKDNWFESLAKSCNVRHFQYLTDAENVIIDISKFNIFLDKHQGIIKN